MWQAHQQYGAEAVGEVIYLVVLSGGLGNIVRYGPNKLLVNSNTGLHGAMGYPLDVDTSNNSHRHLRSYQKGQEIKGLPSYCSDHGQMDRFLCD